MKTLSTLLLVPLDDNVVFPNMNVTISADVGDEDRVLLVPRHDGEYAKVGTVAEIGDHLRLPGGIAAVNLVGLHRGDAGDAHTDAQGLLRVEVQERPDEEPPGVRTRELEREYRAVVEEILELRGDDGRISSFVRSIREVGTLADTAAYAPEITFEQRIELLEAVDIVQRLELALRLQRERLAELQIRHRIREDVEEGAQRQQREYILRRQLESIRKELGEDDASVSEDYRARIAEADLPDAVREQAEREVARLERMGDQSGESSMIRTYLDWLLAVPWGERSEERLDPVHAREVLDSDHAGLEDVKERIVEYLAVRKLRQERGIAEDKRSGAILTLIGPPGTGKTSVGESIARALNREFERMSLGGVRDEAEIRGHRRTYIGALPGRLVRALRDAGTMNPVILLDEVDKVGADWRGDPSAALLEVLDPAQNHSFRDHYRRADCPRCARQAALLSGVRRADGSARSGDRPGGHGYRRRRPVRRGDQDAGQGRTRPDRPARRRHEGVGTDCPLLRAVARGATRSRRTRLRGHQLPRARACRCNSEGRPERRDHDDDCARVPAHRPAGEAHRRHDRRGHVAGSRAADRWPEAEGPRGSCGRADRRHHPGAKPGRSRRHPRGRPERDELPPGDEPRRGARAVARVALGACAVVAARRSPRRSATQRTSSSVAGRSRSSTSRTRAPSASTNFCRHSAAFRRPRWRGG